MLQLLLRRTEGSTQRYLLLVALLELGLNDEAGVLLAEHQDDLQALWPYGRLLWRFRVDGGANAPAIRHPGPRESIRGGPTCSIPIRFGSIGRRTSRCAAARRRRTSPKRSPRHSRRPMALLNGWRRSRGVLRPTAAAAGEEVDRCASLVIHVKGLRTATPVGS